MLKRLLHAIAQIITGTTQPMVGIPVPPMQAVGPVSQEPTTKRGNKRSAQPTKRQPVKAKPKRKPSAAQSTTAAASRKPKQKPVQPAVKASGENGSQPRTRASKTRQHAK